MWKDKYASFNALEAAEKKGEDYAIDLDVSSVRPSPSSLPMAGTSSLLRTA